MEEGGYCAGSHMGRCVGPATRRCGSCGAVRYCSIAHQKAHWLDHRESCERMMQQMKQAEVLDDFPFSFLKELNKMLAKDNHLPCHFLETLGLHGKGLWRGECECPYWKSVTNQDQEKNEGWNLQSSLCPCTDPTDMKLGRIDDWNAYYSWRQLPLNSPVALLLHQPLTLYHALNMVGSRDPTLLANDKNSLNIHYLGPEQELNQIEVFAELLCLLPYVQINIDFIGPAVPSSRDRDTVSLLGYAQCLDDNCLCKGSSVQTDTNTQGNPDHRGLHIEFWKGLYHDTYQELAKKGQADMVFAPNAGIAAFSSWQLTIELLSKMRLPTIITDYCEEACLLAINCISMIEGCALTYPIQINPFRQPHSLRGKLADLPAYSNCFLFGIN